MTLSSVVIGKIGRAVALSETDRLVLQDLLSRPTHFSAGQDMVGEGSKPAACCVLLDGFACRYVALSDGRRQITSLQIAGDWMDLNSYFLNVMDHSIGAMSDCTIALIPHARISEIIADHPHLTRALWRDSMVDSAIFRRWVVNVGARNSRERMAHLFCELQARMQAAGLADETSMELPLTQTDLADALGISTVHVNRTLQELRAANLISFSRRTLSFPDIRRLRQMGQFDPTYLHMLTPDHTPPPSDQTDVTQAAH